MSLISLELSDAGIMAAGGEPAGLLSVDGQNKASPGFAFPEKNQLLVGCAAEKKARLFPLWVTSHFWDQLNTEPLDHPGPYTQQNLAEIACVHLASIWNRIITHGDEMIVAVPGYYNRKHLGLLLGIANELKIPIKGFVPMALSAAKNPWPGKIIVYLDIHLHRTEVILLNQAEQLTVEDSASIQGMGVTRLLRSWAEGVAAEFVHNTRFDPLHRAASEQELYDRLPGVLEQLQQHPSVDFEMPGGSGIHRVNLTRDLFIKKAEATYAGIRRSIEKILAKREKLNQELVLQLSHRLSGLPGCKDSLSRIAQTHIVELEPGSAALGALDLWNQLAPDTSGQGISFVTGRAWQGRQDTETSVSPQTIFENRRPTHVLYRALAYPLTPTPLLIGLDIGSDEPGIRIRGQIAGVSRKHCSIQLRDDKVMLEDLSTYGTFVDEIRVKAGAALQTGQIIRVGTPGETLQLIACLDANET